MRRAVMITLGLLLVVALPAGTAIGFSRILDGSIAPRAGAPDGNPEAVPTPDVPSPAVPEPDPVAEAQRMLADLGYYVDTVDGLVGPATRSALMAFQKVHDLPRTGELDGATLAALQNPRAPQLRGTDPDRIEVDLTRQVLYVVEDGTVVRILPVSSGNGEGYTSSSGSWAYANTPTGTFTIADSLWLHPRVAVGTTVLVHGGAHVFAVA